VAVDVELQAVLIIKLNVHWSCAKMQCSIPHAEIMHLIFDMW